MRHLNACCLLAAIYLSFTAAQSCANLDQDCDDRILVVSQCTEEVVSRCCSRCTQLAECSNFASNCYSQYDSFSCYNSGVRGNCCLMCKAFQQDFLGPSCLYGDLADGCDVNNCQTSDVYRTNCCGTCYTGTTPAPVPTTASNPTAMSTTVALRQSTSTTTVAPQPSTSTTTVAPQPSTSTTTVAPQPSTSTTTVAPQPSTSTTTVAPQIPTTDVCEDKIDTCATTIASVPSTCYNAELKDRCCASCADFMDDRETTGYNVSVCPYGDRAVYCISDSFNTDQCDSNDNSFICCDTCGVTPTVSPPCEDSGTISCDLSPSRCYTDVSDFYATQCCATCRLHIKVEQEYSCRYGDRQDGCEVLIPFGQVCSAEQEMACCETCQKAVMTTTPEACSDTSSACGLLVGGIARNCYELEDTCCGTCRQLRLPGRPESCKFGDKVSLCSTNVCGSLADECCATCNNITTTPMITTRPPCQDTEAGCLDGIYNLRVDSYRCYRDDIRNNCCNTCRQLEKGDGDCAWGNREPICAELSVIDCNNEDTRTVCCEECSELTTPMTTTPDLPPDCVDSLQTCNDLTEESLYSCYEGEFLSDRCCASCFRKQKKNLPIECSFGDRLQSCSTFISDGALCLSDEAVQRDCCETCHAFQATTTTTSVGPTICPNEWSDVTCETLLTQLSGNCSSIREKCCRTCYVAPTTTMPTTTADSCVDILPSDACNTIITAEGADQCLTDYVRDNCCASCRVAITTTTEGPRCPGDALTNCAAIQELLADQDICEDQSSFRQSCCEYCGDNQSPTTPMGTTTLPAGCEANLWSVAVCSATIETSPLDDPCGSELIGDSCCVYCAMLNSMSTATTMMGTTTEQCLADDPSLDCASLNNQIDVCANDLFTKTCCHFCGTRDSSTTPSTTTLGTGFCSFNVLAVPECQAIVDVQGLTACATDLMIESCCLFCRQLTFPPTTTMPTTKFCGGNGPDLNCTLLDEQFSNNLCTPLVSDSLREACCEYCNNLPTTATTAEPTTSVCVDILQNSECVAIASSGQCSSVFGIESCCASCAPTTSTTATTSTTTEAPSTAPCIDKIDCFNVSQSTDVCGGSAILLEACCAFCANRTTIAPIPTVTPGPCTGNSFDVQLCSDRLNVDPDFCTTDATWLGLCCEFCGVEVITGSTSAVLSSDATTAAAVSTTTGPEQCTENLFSVVLCQNGIQGDVTVCDDPSWYSVCCVFCDDLRAQASRKRRSIEGETIDVSKESEVDVVRSKRQTFECSTKDEFTCEAVVYNSNTEPKWLVCVEDYMRVECCGYCARVSADGAVPEGCWNDTFEKSTCQTVVGEQGLEACSNSLIQQSCCLTCALTALRTQPLTTPPPTTQQPTTQPPTTQPPECEQIYQNSTCVLLLASLNCSSPVIISKCCDFACTETTTHTGETTTLSPTTSQIVTTTTTTTTTTFATTTVHSDLPPNCADPDFAQTCTRFVYAEPSECYSELVFKDCCQSCTEFYYERKAGGFNVEMCAYGNRDDSCSVVDCSDAAEAMRCCDVCYPKMDVTTRAVVGSLTADYSIILVIDTPCLESFSDPNSFPYEAVSDFVITGLQEIFSTLPGTQVYTVPAISCNSSDINSPVKVHAAMQTPTTHTFNELLDIYNEASEDGVIGVLDIDTSMSNFYHQELYDGQCKMDGADNCELYATTPGSECYESAAYDNCCASCNNMSRVLYGDRKYIPEGCEYGDKDKECADNIDCDSAEAKRQCCYTCAVEPEDYNQQQTSTTTPEMTTTPVQTTTSAAVQTTTTPQACLADTSNKCHNLTRVIRSCYNKPLVYDVCCKSCDSVTLQYLPSECAWGDKEGWCVGITQEQCSDSSFYETCCETCGPHLSTSPTTQTTTTVTTTTPCVDQLVNCANLTIDPSFCYLRNEECCSSCEALALDYLNSTCKYGDKQAYCLNIDVDDCVDPQYLIDCCKTCNPPPSTTSIPTSTQTSAVTTASTTASTTTTATTVTVTVSDPGCVADAGSACSVLTTNGGCYNTDVEDSCCLTCASLYDQDAPNNCRYGDHNEYCTAVTRERCLTESRVFTDCCKTCEGLVAPPGVCIDKAANCDVLTADPADCYFDLIYSECCQMCEEKVKDYLPTTCRWGDLNDFCTFYQRDDCETFDGLKEQCCGLCTDVVTTTPPPTTTTEPQCIDSPSSNCQQDTAEARYCYDEGVADDCCASCRILSADRPASCSYGDKEEWCEYFTDEKDRCSDDYVRETCCELCAPPTTTPGPTTSACYDISNCTGPISSCYEDMYKSVCCATCKAAYDLDALFGCEYGDKEGYCRLISRDQCIEIEQVRTDCCDTCPRLTATTTSETSAQTTSTSTTSTTTTPPTTQPPQCVDSDVLGCADIDAEDCYDDAVRDTCCSRCRSYEKNDATCLYGDRDASFCTSPLKDCSLSVVKTLCCESCSDFVVPSNVQATYRLEINVTSLRCTVGLNDRTTDEFVTFKYNMEAAVDDILADVPGIQFSVLVDIRCGSVFGILEIVSVGFYDLVEMNRVIMTALSTGLLEGPQQAYSVSVTGSTLRALSFEAPSCVRNDDSINCLTDFVLKEPSTCYEAQVRAQCCSSCSSLFYARLAAGFDMESCPYGDKDSECFTEPEINCYVSDSMSRCCDRCAGATTSTPSTSTTTEMASTTTTPEPCVDEEPALCAQGVENSLSFCYTENDKCCATCKSRRIVWLPEQCAWGDKSVSYCAQQDKTDCASDPTVNSTCCKLCFNADVSPTGAPCAADDVNFDCSPVQISPAFCYDSEYSIRCCKSCHAARMNYLPSGCEYGDKADFCDSSNLICSTYGDDLCCGTCCTDCQSPSPETSSTTTAPTTTTQYKPPGCEDAADCEDIVMDPSSCYSEQINSSCCLSCYNIRRFELPETCSYGDKVTATCSGIKWENCTDSSEITADICCGTCYSLLDVSCNETVNQASNCEVATANPATCYSQGGLEKCCATCKRKAVYSLPESCRFGDKVLWCSDITDMNIDSICRQSDNQQQCCQTCRNYVGVSTTLPPSTTVLPSTTVTTTTRLPPNEECPLGDLYSNCTEQTSPIGACYDPQIGTNCCRTCYQLWRDDLPFQCRYGDKSPYCITTLDSIIDYDWCKANEETCCARCQPYLTTTVPTTTLPAQCPNGNSRDDCSTQVQNAYNCYSPVRREGCCVQCANFIRPDLPSNCEYGDKASFCQEITIAECAEHAETCCEKCSSAATTTPPTTTIPSTASTTTPSTQPAVQTTTPTATTPLINRVTPVIGQDLFKRPVPPGDITLFKASFNLDEGCSGVAAELKKIASSEFKIKERDVCFGVSQKMWSVTNCYLKDVSCSAAGRLTYTIYIMVDKSINYDNIDFSKDQLERELESQSRRRKRNISYMDVLIEDVNECDETNERLADACSDLADCTNSEGLYTCTCASGLEGDGFTCRTRVDPRIGRSDFSRSVPPGYEYLYQLQLTINYTANVKHGCFDGMNEPTSTAFQEKETLICSALGEALLSLKSCYVDDFNCDNYFRVTLHILIDAEINYDSKSVSTSIIKNELAAYNGKITANLVQDVDECFTNYDILKNGCHESASCINSPGLYACSCTEGYSGDGFSCKSPESQTVAVLEDWSIAIIAVGAVILLVAILLACVCCCRHNRRKNPRHEQLTAGEDTPPLDRQSGPILYNSMRSTYQPQSEYADSYFYAPQEKELPSYSHKTYNVASHVANMGDTTTFEFQ